MKLWCEDEELQVFENPFALFGRFSRSLSPFVQVLSWSVPLGMDHAWVHRLVDEQPGLSFLTEYCRLLRLVSGLSGLGCLRARRVALTHRIDRGFRAHILSEPQVPDSLAFLNEFSAGELPVVFEILRQHLFLDSPSRCLFLFQASQLDPRRNLEEALRAASTDLRELEQCFGPSLSLPNRWSPTTPQGVYPVDITSVLTTMASVPNAVCPVLPSAVAGIYGPSCFGVPFVDPEIPFADPPVLRKAAVYVTFRGEYICTKMADLKPNTTGEHLLQVLWPPVIEATSTTKRRHH